MSAIVMKRCYMSDKPVAAAVQADKHVLRSGLDPKVFDPLSRSEASPQIWQENPAKTFRMLLHLCSRTTHDTLHWRRRFLFSPSMLCFSLYFYTGMDLTILCSYSTCPLLISLVTSHKHAL